ncbi:hypothetical protein DKT77_02395 [Meridianimarinicoccus roseus]|uniref:DnaA N-terminal domain-containing protein n=1 Tax=Meridianimarinicoccus roseus TaxID=2072018 RepID=A0A2V2LJK0_9RHOB|nr:DnaA N-terminal domain-containing protein [Meridianimarinicoccus roseus]PWR04251.1 hypothetical protein DKT77_02395 [Meridianimarinicoccus roseus]
MQPGRVTGPGSGVHKYDILTAVAIAGLHGSTTQQVSALRLISLITARYNWQRNELSIGQEEMARIWGVNTRTAKREVKRLVSMGLLDVKRAGVRGRVACYRLNLEALETLSRPVWSAVGPDFEERAGRLLSRVGSAEGTVLKVDFSPTQRETKEIPADTGCDSRWQDVMTRLSAENPDAYANWYKRLTLGRVTDGTVEVTAPNAFVSNYIATHLADPMAAAVRDAFGPCRVSLVLAS